MVRTIATQSPETLNDLERAGINPYPYFFKATHSCESAKRAYGRDSDGGETDFEVRVMGRIVGLRGMGEFIFFDILDRSGSIQVCVRRSQTPRAHNLVEEFVSRGDHVGVEGPVFKTNRGELTVRANSVEILSKCLRPLPDKFHGVRDAAILRSERHVDLMVNRESRERFINRSRII